jgi:threonine efflux protein
MSDFLPFLKVFPVLLLSLMSPEPNFIMISNLALAKGRASGIQCALGMATGDLIYSSLSLLGLGLLLQQDAQLMIVLKIVGGIYLGYLGFQILRLTFQRKPASSEAISQTPQEQARNPYLVGILTSTINPKVIIFYGSIFTLAILPDSNAVTKISLPLLCALTSFLWYGFVAVALSVRRLRSGYQKWAKTIDRGAGMILLLFGAKLIFSGRS